MSLSRDQLIKLLEELAGRVRDDLIATVGNNHEQEYEFAVIPENFLQLPSHLRNSVLIERLPIVKDWPEMFIKTDDSGYFLLVSQKPFPDEYHPRDLFPAALCHDESNPSI